MRFSKELIKIGDDFRKNELNSDDISDRTEKLDDWTKMKVKTELSSLFSCMLQNDVC